MIALTGRIEEGMKFADLHLHTNLSHDGTQSPEQLIDMAEATGYLSEIAITDHGVIEGAWRARWHAKKKDYRVKVITGQEITTTHGDMIGLYLQRPIRDGLRPRETAKRIHHQGGLVYIPHPFFKMFNASGFGIRGCEMLLDMDIVDVWEGFNAGMASWRNRLLTQNNDRALNFYLDNPDRLGALAAASDGHGYMPGWAFTGYHGDLRQALEERKTIPARLDEAEEDRLVRLAMMYYNTEEVDKVNKIRARHKLPLYGTNKQIEVLMAKARRQVQVDDLVEILSSEELDVFERKLKRQKDGKWDATNWAASRLAAKLGYQIFHPEKPLKELVIDNQKQDGQAKTGAPYVKDYEDLFCSLTHWGEYGAAVVATHLVGIDISGLRPSARNDDPMMLSSVLLRVASYGEMPLQDIIKETWEDSVTRIWSFKEATYKGPRTSKFGKTAIPEYISGTPDSRNAFRVRITDRFPHDYWWANVIKIEDGIHLAVAFPQNCVPNGYTNRFGEEVELKDVLKPVVGLPPKIADAFEVSSLHT